jgi:6-phosphogluconolactonase (cycloisomerase 2 family)
LPRQNVAKVAFNRGKVSPLALARTDIERVELSAEEQTNFVPRVLGSMMLRPGWKWLGSTLSDSQAFLVPFVKSTDDTAFIEFTNESIRVWEDDAPIERSAVSTVIRGGDFSSDVTNFLKVDDPATTPGANANDVAFSPDGQLMAVAKDTASSRCIEVYAVDGTSLTLLSALASHNSANAGAVAFSPDGTLLSLGHTGSVGFQNWVITGTGASAVFTKLADPNLDPGTTVNGLAYSPDGLFLAIAHATSPFITIYQVDGTGLDTTYTALSSPSDLPASTGNGVAWSPDGRFLAVAHDTSPYCTVYEVNGITFTKLDDASSQFSADLPAGNGQTVAFSRDGLWMSVAHTTTPFVTIYSISGTTFTKVSNPSTLPDGNGRGVAFSSDNQFLAVVHETSPYLSHYRLVSGTWTKQSDPATAPDGTGNRVAFSPNNQLMVVAHDASAYLTVYQAYQWLDMDGSGATSSYLSATFSTAFSETLSTTAGVAFNGHTIRQAIDDSVLTRGGSRIRITFQAAAVGTFAITKCYIGKRSFSGDVYDFNSAPTQVTFNGGSAGFSISTGATITSDEIAFNLEQNGNYLIAYRISGTNDDMAAADDALAGTLYAPYYKAGDDVTTINASGYTSLAATKDNLGIQKIEVVEELGDAGLSLVGTNYNDARRIQAVSVLDADKDTEHGIRLIVGQGLVQFHVGTSFGDDDLVAKRELGPGVYSFAFTPEENLFFVELHSYTKYTTIVESCQIDGGGDLTISTPYTTDDLVHIRHAQSGDVIYLACQDTKQQKVMRFGSHSWGVADYLPEDGPFREENNDFTTLTASALTGDITITASKPTFKEAMVGTLFRISSTGQATSDSFTAENQFSDPIKVTGADTARNLSITRAGTWSATITLQRSISEPGTWTDVATFTSNGTATYNDDLDNQVVYYRIGIKTGNYTSGTAVVDMSYSQGTIDGIARVTAYTSPTVVSAIVLSPMGGTSAFEHWAEGLWSDYRGYPSSVAIYEGRLAWAGMDRIILSESDGYENFNDLEEGDSGPIIRSIGDGPVDDIHWLLPLQRLLAGAEGSELSIRSNSFDEPLTPSNFNMKACSTQGSAAVGPVRFDSSGAFVERSGTRLYQLVYNFDTYDYSSSDLTRLAPDICEAGIKKIVLQRHPDTRIHCVLNDGTVALLVFEPDEKVVCWVVIETDGDIEDAVVLPQQQLEDAVYYVVNRTINGETKRYVEKWALENECQGSTLNKQLDSFIIYDGVSTTSLTGLDHLEGETVAVWGNGAYLNTYTVSSGAITVSSAVTDAVIGLPYTARYKSSKLAYAAAGGTALNQRKRICKVGMILYNTHHDGLRIGDSFDFLRALPTVIENKAVTAGTIHDEFDWDSNAYNTKWSPDARLCLEATAPKPVTVLAATIEIETNG